MNYCHHIEWPNKNFICAKDMSSFRMVFVPNDFLKTGVRDNVLKINFPHIVYLDISSSLLE